MGLNMTGDGRTASKGEQLPVGKLIRITLPVEDEASGDRACRIMHPCRGVACAT